jgi:hypothetical protein
MTSHPDVCPASSLAFGHPTPHRTVKEILETACLVQFPDINLSSSSSSNTPSQDLLFPPPQTLFQPFSQSKFEGHQSLGTNLILLSPSRDISQYIEYL